MCLFRDMWYGVIYCNVANLCVHFDEGQAFFKQSGLVVGEGSLKMNRVEDNFLTDSP